MSDDVLAAQIASARAYQSLFVPSLLAPWAEMVADAAGIAPEDRVLDVACGTGVLTLEAAKRSGVANLVCGLDPNPGMLAVAAELNPQIVWRRGQAESLPFADEEFGVALCQFGLMFFSDRAAALREMRRTLRPGGRMALAVWNTLEHNPVYATLVELLANEAGSEAAAALSAPFACGERSALYRLLDDAGFSAIVVQTRAGQARFPSLRSVVEAEILGWLPLMGVNLDESASTRLIERALSALSSYTQPNGEAHFPVSAHIVSATRS